MATTTVLCLHGCCQTADAFRSYLKSNVLEIGKKTGITFHFLKGQYDHPEGGKTWTDPPLVVADIWYNKDTGLQTSPELAVPKLKPDYDILKETFAQIDMMIGETGATVLLGFSQGAFAIYEYMRFTRDPRITRLVAMAGYTFDNLNPEGLSGAEGAEDPKEPPLNVEIMNVGNPFDPIVPISLAYTNALKVVTMTHNNKELTEYNKMGHVVPSRKPQARDICTFITSGSVGLE